MNVFLQEQKVKYNWNLVFMWFIDLECVCAIISKIQTTWVIVYNNDHFVSPKFQSSHLWIETMIIPILKVCDEW